MSEKALFEMYRKDVYKTCYFMLHNAADAEDMCQDVFVTVFRHDWRKVEHLKTWLLRVTVNHCLNQLKKSKRAKTREKVFHLSSVRMTEKGADTVAEERESAMECLQMLQQLPIILKTVVSLRFMSDCSLKEISDILCIPVGTVKSRLNKGIKLLQRMTDTAGTTRGKDDGIHGQNGSNVYSAAER